MCSRIHGSSAYRTASWFQPLHATPRPWPTFFCTPGRSCRTARDAVRSRRSAAPPCCRRRRAAAAVVFSVFALWLTARGNPRWSWRPSSLLSRSVLLPSRGLQTTRGPRPVPVYTAVWLRCGAAAAAAAAAATTTTTADDGAEAAAVIRVRCRPAARALRRAAAAVILRARRGAAQLPAVLPAPHRSVVITCVHVLYCNNIIVCCAAPQPFRRQRRRTRRRRWRPRCPYNDRRRRRAADKIDCSGGRRLLWRRRCRPTFIAVFRFSLERRCSQA